MRISVVAAFVLAWVPAAGQAQSRVSEFASGLGTNAYLTAGLLLPLLRDGQEGKGHFLRTADALGTTVLTTEVLKRLTRVRRPEEDTLDSFPSNHASTTFAIATAQSAFHPREAPLWFAGATLISLSRLDLQRHRVDEVLVGAALGYGVMRLELSLPRGLIIAPFVGRRGLGLQLQARFSAR